MKEKVWVFCYNTSRVLCCYIDSDVEVQDYLKNKGINPNECSWFCTSQDTELEYLS